MTYFLLTVYSIIYKEAQKHGHCRFKKICHKLVREKIKVMLFNVSEIYDIILRLQVSSKVLKY